ncbi:tetratricopeptide repeat protein [Streptomyces olivochromogenes]|uniref:tetratricopeptide repeat protein n=1 Tax=Streptomyces olivochromogenes TaxID=1963 RepID=UPI001F22885C|nr:tetratricopeptide repeat protein [Streptomyces olivochromogenes]MCF3130033.1 tetratricopeptide repeat protein [Streptomyces olivochromogenes]
MGDATSPRPDGNGTGTGAGYEPDVTVGTDLLDFRAGRFHGDVVGKKVEHHHHTPTGTRALRSLPAPVRGFVGRRREVDALLRALDPVASARGAVLVSAVAGLGGIGKTALALQAAHEAQHRGLFPAGVVFLDLHGYDDVPVTPDQALEQLLRALGVPRDQIPVSADARAGLYRSVLAELAEELGALLIVADNASRSAQVAPLMPGHPRHRVLVTSRETLSQLGAQMLHLGVLPPEVAVEALDTALRTADPTDSRIRLEAYEAGRLSALCGRLPLALHIAAALLVNDPGKPVAELADELADATHLIDHLDDGERAMRAAFDMSYRRLPEVPARLLRLLALAPGPEAGLEALTALSGSAPARRDLDVLVRAHLIETGSRRGRWHMHDLVRAYGVAQAQEDAIAKADAQAARARLLSRYNARVVDAHAHLKPVNGKIRPSGFTDRDEALAWLDAERAQLVAAAQWSADPEHADSGVRLALSLCHYLGWRRAFDDAALVYHYAIEGARLLGDSRREGMAFDNLGIALRHLRRNEEAIAAHRSALEVFGALGSRPGQGRARYNLGNALLRARRFGQALEAFEEAGALLDAPGSAHDSALAQNGLGTAYMLMGRCDEALRHIARAHDASREMGDTCLEADSVNNRGRAWRGLTRFDVAREDHLRAVGLFRSLGRAEGVATAQNDLAITLRVMGRAAEAVHQHTEALRALRRQGERYREANVLNDLGSSLRAAGRPDEAADCHQGALALFRDVFSDVYGQACSLDRHAAAVLDTGDTERARRSWHESARLYREAGADEEAGAALRQAGAVSGAVSAARSREAADD